mmetsp:Transcript_19203/g.32116  ORF Transcript_19203/g.32116 Transcript_19203/m.32116 type:complete len:229 (+) Transcript_19203:162-848(+)
MVGNICVLTIASVNHFFAVVSKKTLSASDVLVAPEATRFLGMFVWLTVQTNLICAGYYILSLVSYVLNSHILDAVLVRAFPLSFGLGFQLSILYYTLDHWNPENVKRRRTFSAKGFPHCELAAHIEHALATPVALLQACSLSLPAGIACPSGMDVLRHVGLYATFYLMLSIINRFATGRWQYPVLEDAQKATGVLGVAAFFCAIVAIGFTSSFLGIALLSALGRCNGR